MLSGSIQIFSHCILEICLTSFEYSNSYNSKSFSITFPYKPIILFILCVASFTPSRPFQSQKLSRFSPCLLYLIKRKQRLLVSTLINTYYDYFILSLLRYHVSMDGLLIFFMKVRSQDLMVFSFTLIPSIIRFDFQQDRLFLSETRVFDDCL